MRKKGRALKLSERAYTKPPPLAAARGEGGRQRLKEDRRQKSQERSLPKEAVRGAACRSKVQEVLGRHPVRHRRRQALSLMYSFLLSSAAFLAALP